MAHTTGARTDEHLEAPGGGGVEAAEAHPSERKYVVVAIILAVITALEVGLYYIELPDVVLVLLLAFFSILKFGMVALYFMHLKQDSPLLRRLFLTGVLLAGGVYTAVLLNFFLTD